MRQSIKLTESQLRGMIQEAIEDAMNDECVDEGLWNQMKTGVKTFANNSGNLKNRWGAAKKNYQTQGQMDQMDSLKGDMVKVQDKLQQMLDSGLLTPQTTVEQILSNQTKFNSFSGKRANLQGQINRRMRG